MGCVPTPNNMEEYKATTSGPNATLGLDFGDTK